MSDLSLPPLSLVPLPTLDADALPAPAQEPAPGQTARRAVSTLPWPAPPCIGYALPAALGAPEPCELEGPNGKVNAGRLLAIDLDAGQVQVLIPPGRTPLTLRFTQFRRLSLLRPLEPLPDSSHSHEATTPLLPQNLLQPYRLRFKDGSTAQVSSVGLLDKPLGLFTFSPIDRDGRLLRSLYPRPMLVAVEAAPAGAPPGDDQQDTAPMALDELPGAQAAQPPTLGDMLSGGKISTAEQLAKAIDQQAKMPMVRIGEALVGLGFITEAATGRRAEAAVGRPPPAAGRVAGQQAAGDAAPTCRPRCRARWAIPIVDVEAFPVENEAALRLPLTGGAPPDGAAADDARRPPGGGAGRPVGTRRPSTRSSSAPSARCCRCWPAPAPWRAPSNGSTSAWARTASSPRPTWSRRFNFDVDGATTPTSCSPTWSRSRAHGSREDETPIEQSDNSLVRLINTMILEAKQGGVSDIHIECQPGTQKVQVRFRRDGVLKPYIELPHTYRSALVARIKIMCDLDISERRKPQDGKINFGRWSQGQKLELRVATIPTANGLEDVVMRLLASAKTLPLEGMGMQPDTLAKLKAAVERPYGMVLCVGPTGSGKTTTLHAALGHINTPERKIWTAEDPVEITQPGLRQVQVNPEDRLDLRQGAARLLARRPRRGDGGRDPRRRNRRHGGGGQPHRPPGDEHPAHQQRTRDGDPAAGHGHGPVQLCRQPAGGAGPAPGAPAVQALRHQPPGHAPKTCRAWSTATCSSYPDASQRPDGDALLADWTARFGVEGRLLHHHAPGCSHCDNSGYASRVGLHELLVVSRELRHLIQTSARAEQLQQAAMNEGMRTLRQDGILKVLAGLTSDRRGAGDQQQLSAPVALRVCASAPCRRQTSGPARRCRTAC